MATLTINGKSYDIDQLSPAALAQVKSLQFVDGELERLQATIAVFQTARVGYINALKPLLKDLRDTGVTLQ